MSRGSSGGRPRGDRDQRARSIDEPSAKHSDLPEADPDQVARLILLRRLEAAPRTRAELARTLAQRGVPDDSAARVLDRFEEVGLVDDPTFARMWVQSRHSGRLLSRSALRQELTRRGIEADTISEALEEVSDESERAAAVQLARRKAAGMSGLPTDVQARRLAGALARKGYATGLCYAVVREVLAEQEGDLGEGP